ncbi:MAG: hypoxanthine phosphoribosyltransferase [Candidatus Saccharibacteria bacterium]|nr:hypoxanthine phosphoribosyltransferase [Candidatus Saccharibacteria bacterium]
MHNDIQKILISQSDIAEITYRLGTELTTDYHDKNPLVVGILRGSLPFMADIIRAIDCHLEIDFMSLSSYEGGTQSLGRVRIIKDLDTSVAGRHVLIIEDIVDTGRTLHEIKQLLAHRGAASVRICTLLDKPSGRAIDITPDYVGTEIPGEFVVGYGLDYQEKYRNLPYIGVLKPEVYQKATAD